MSPHLEEHFDSLISIDENDDDSDLPLRQEEEVYRIR